MHLFITILYSLFCVSLPCHGQARARGLALGCSSHGVGVVPIAASDRCRDCTQVIQRFQQQSWVKMRVLQVTMVVSMRSHGHPGHPWIHDDWMMTGDTTMDFEKPTYNQLHPCTWKWIKDDQRWSKIIKVCQWWSKMWGQILIYVGQFRV